jgi:hypothetical protein
MRALSQTSQDDTEISSSCGYDECVSRLARALDQHQDADLEEVACLIGQLAVVIEL